MIYHAQDEYSCYYFSILLSRDSQLQNANGCRIRVQHKEYDQIYLLLFVCFEEGAGRRRATIMKDPGKQIMSVPTLLFYNLPLQV